MRRVEEAARNSVLTADSKNTSAQTANTGRTQRAAILEDLERRIAAHLGTKARIIHSTFEAVTLDRRFDHIILTHVLEHLDDPVAVLKRVNNEWLSDAGRFFLVCPNGNAASRQEVAKLLRQLMGLPPSAPAPGGTETEAPAAEADDNAANNN